MLNKLFIKLMRRKKSAPKVITLSAVLENAIKMKAVSSGGRLKIA